MRTFTAEQVATDFLHCSVERVAELCRSGVIPARRPGRVWVISEQALDAYLAPVAPVHPNVAGFSPRSLKGALAS